MDQKLAKLAVLLKTGEKLGGKYKKTDKLFGFNVI